MTVQLLHSVLVMTIVLSWLGLANSVMWISPPDIPFTYHLVAKDGWWMAVFDQSWQHLALVWPERIEICDPYTGKTRRTLSPPEPYVKFTVAPAFSKDGMLIAVPFSDGTLRVWSWPVGQELHVLPGPYEGNTPAFSPDGRLLAALGSKKEIIVWDLQTGYPMHTFTQFQTLVGPFIMGFDHQGGQLFARATTPSGAHLTGLWNVHTGQLVQVLPGIALLSPDDTIYLLEPSPDGQTTVWRWDKTRSNLDLMHIAPGPMVGASLRRDGRLLALALADGTVRLLDMKHWGRQLYKLDPRIAIPDSEGVDILMYVYWSPDGQLLATSTRFWETTKAYLHLWNVVELP